MIQRLKSALWYSIGSTIDAISLEQNINATPQFIGALTELVWTQIANSSQDLERFAKYVIPDIVPSPFPFDFGRAHIPREKERTARTSCLGFHG